MAATLVTATDAIRECAHSTRPVTYVAVPLTPHTCSQSVNQFRFVVAIALFDTRPPRKIQWGQRGT